MKKTFPVNINGSVFYIDEDAYNLLNTYLDQLRKAFPGAEGREIVADIEARIAELFGDIIARGARVITIADVNDVIAQMGTPGDLSGDEGGSEADASASGPTTPPPFADTTATASTGKRLYRDERNKVFGGVVSGLACYTGWNVTIMRVLLLVLAICTKLFPLTIVYLVAWMVIPPARTQRQILEMTGRPVTPGNIGSTILGDMDPAAPTAGQGGEIFQNFFSILGKIILAFCGLVAACVGIGFVGVLIAAICGLIVYSGWGTAYIFDNAFDNFFPAAEHPVIGGIGVALMAVAVAIPCIAIVWAACCTLFKARGASKSVIVTTALLEVVLIIASVVMLTVANVTPTL